MTATYSQIGERALREALVLRGGKVSEDEFFRRFRTLIEDLDEVMTGAEAKCAMGTWLDAGSPAGALEIGEVLVEPGAGAVTRLQVAVQIAESLPAITKRLLTAAERHARRQMARTAKVAS